MLPGARPRKRGAVGVNAVVIQPAVLTAGSDAAIALSASVPPPAVTAAAGYGVSAAAVIQQAAAASVVSSVTPDGGFTSTAQPEPVWLSVRERKRVETG